MNTAGLPPSTAPWRAVVAALIVAVIGLGAHAHAGAEVSVVAAAAVTLSWARTT